jgi:hypothetical protein
MEWEAPCRELPFLVGTPDGLEIVNLTASVLMAVALLPYGIGIITKKTL